MRKRFLLLAVGLAMMPGQVRADVPVVDIAGDLQLIKDYTLSLKSWVLQNTQAVSEANIDIQTAKSYVTLLETYVAFVQHPSLGTAEFLLNASGLKNDLPVDPVAMAQIARGFKSLSHNGGKISLNSAFGLLNTLGRFISISYDANHVYACLATDPVCADINARGDGIAGSMGTTQSVYADLQAHQAAMQALRDQLDTVTDPAKRETIIAQLQIEQVWTQNLAAQLQASMSQANLQQQSFQQRTVERQRQSADQLLADTQPVQ